MRLAIGFVLGAFLVCVPCVFAVDSAENAEQEEVIVLGQRACAPASRFGEASIPGGMSETEYQSNRADSQRLFAGAGASRTIGQSAIGMETFGDAFGANTTNRVIEIHTPGTSGNPFNGTFIITGDGGTLNSNSYSVTSDILRTWVWYGDVSSSDIGFSGYPARPNVPNSTSSTPRPPSGSIPNVVTGVVFSGAHDGKDFSSTQGISFDLILPAVSGIVGASNVNDSAGLRTAVESFLMGSQPGIDMLQVDMNSSLADVNTTYTQFSTTPSVSSVSESPVLGFGVIDPYEYQQTEISTETDSYAFAVPADFAQFVYDYFGTYSTPGSSSRILMPQTTLGRIKITENFNPLPVDRLIFDYSFFYRTPLTDRGVNVHRFTPGIEKTFFNGLTSVELRIPMGVSLDNNLQNDGSTITDSGEFGDITLIFKGLLLRREKFLMSAGLSLSLPTADDTYLWNSATGQKMMRIANDSYHIMPFVAFQFMPNKKWYTQLYYQIDIDSNGSRVFDNPELGFGTERLRYSGKISDMTYQYTSATLGRWIYRNDRKRQGLTAMNVVGELHWTKSLDRGKDVDIKGSGGETIYRVTNGRNNCDLLNATVGTHMIFNRRTNLGVAYAVPLTSTYRQFDGEARVTLNWYF